MKPKTIKPEPDISETAQLPKCTIEIKLVGGILILDAPSWEQYENYIKDML